ncbi:hypothetical protein [Streptomyces sp. NPDC093589]
MRIGIGQFLVCDYERSAAIAQAEAEAEAEAHQAYYEARWADD